MTRGKKLEKLRGERTQKYILDDIPKKLGDQYHINKNTLSNAEGDRPISNTTMEILANYYEVSLDYLKNDIVENSTNENININKILGFSDKTILKIKTFNEKKYIIPSLFQVDINNLNNNYGFNKWLEDNNYFDEFCFFLNRYYMINYGLKLVFYFAFIDSIEQYLITNEYDNTKDIIRNLIEKYNLLDDILASCEIKIDRFSEIMTGILKLEKHLKNKSSSELIKDDIFTIETLGTVVFDELKLSNKYVKYELSEIFSNSLPIIHSEIESVYYDTDIPEDYIEISKNKSKNKKDKKGK